jgi:hypothetical protein
MRSINAIFITSTFCNSFHIPDTDITDTKRTITKNNDQTINEPSKPRPMGTMSFCAIKNVYGTNGMDGDDRMNSATRQLFFFFVLHYTQNMLFSALPDVQRF